MPTGGVPFVMRYGAIAYAPSGAWGRSWRYPNQAAANGYTHQIADDALNRLGGGKIVNWVCN
ncbi:hypothetical protein HMPREF0591_0314 [Mycobacterium parascrofulaceum ATCC BAA-614]|uniref:Uncharacterized protein n=1 Tax=Mycobacterium parascrofulaceum ATCC BAA-614 TaxID=525368 RepID=D5P2C8_9MYCO|nr:hypothetical protein HMPREF0591_0314 [Mycobacterium parascrofulaceum ATCC BAA-614]